MAVKDIQEQAPESDNIIEVRNLKKFYGEIKAVNDVSFDVKRGSLFAFLGLNGAGKSTTINILCSILKKDSGKVIIDGNDLERDAAKIKRSIGIVFQNSVLDAQLTVMQNLKSRASLYFMSKTQTLNRIDELCELLDLSAILKRPLSNLSGGQRRKADIARALIHSPKLLFFDEPTTGLDPSTRKSVWQIIERLIKTNNMTLFLTTHYMEEAVRADKVMIIDNGKIAECGSPDELKQKYTSDFIRIICPQNEKTEEMLAKNNKEFKFRNNSYYIKSSSVKGTLAFLTKNKAHIKDFEVLKGDMDDVFLNITGKQLED